MDIDAARLQRQGPFAIAQGVGEAAAALVDQGTLEIIVDQVGSSGGDELIASVQVALGLLVFRAQAMELAARPMNNRLRRRPVDRLVQAASAFVQAIAVLERLREIDVCLNWWLRRSRPRNLHARPRVVRGGPA